MDTQVKLHSGYFWSAGQSFGWAKEDPGVGIDVAKIRKAMPDGRVIVTSKYDKLSIKASKALEIANTCKSYMTFGKRRVAVIPKSKFTKETKEENTLFGGDE